MKSKELRNWMLDVHNTLSGSFDVQGTPRTAIVNRLYMYRRVSPVLYRCTGASISEEAVMSAMDEYVALDKWRNSPEIGGSYDSVPLWESVRRKQGFGDIIWW